MSRVEPFSAPAIGAYVPEDELETPPLPAEHPPWIRDAVAVSRRARTMLASLRPIAVRVLGFWDHAVRSVHINGRRLSIDVSGSYRLR